jgi:hypothetical protein
VEGQWNNIKKCLFDAMTDCVGKVENTARKPWITQEVISKIHKRRKWKNYMIESRTYWKRME